MLIDPDQEAARLADLSRYHVLDTEAEPGFDRVTALAAQLFEVPIALVSLVDRDRQWFKSCVGLPIRETEREISFCAHALTRDRPLVVPDALADPRFQHSPLVTGPPFIRFYAGAPLRSPAAHVLGTLCIIDRAPRTFGERDQSLLMDLAAVVMDALELRLRTEQLDRARIELTTILDGMDELVVAIDRDRRTTLFNRAAREQLGPASPEADPEGWVKSTQILLPDRVTPYPPERLPIIRALAGETTRGELIIVQARGEARWHSVNACPLRDATGEVIGGVSVGRDITEERQLAERLEHATIHDELTGVLNRRGFMMMAEKHLAISRRMRRPALLLYFDLDGLKPINDEHGHAAGDRTIRDAARVIAGGLREIDVVARLGGDELVALCVDTPLDKASVVLHRLREHLESANREPRPAPIAWSVGLVGFEPDQPRGLDELLSAADQAMYGEKARRPRRTGR